MNPLVIAIVLIWALVVVLIIKGYIDNQKPPRSGEGGA